MQQEPEIKGLSTTKRKWFFRALVLVFLMALPTVIFYTAGYRLSFEEESTGFVTTGGMYVDTASADVQVYLNDEEIVRPRLFRNAYYLQNIAAGQHRIVVQAPGVHTWVKELPVDAHIVTEATAFNVPTTPRLRSITRYIDDAGAAVYFVPTTTNAMVGIFGDATSTVPVVFSTSTDTTIYTENPESAFVRALFASSTVDTISVFADNVPDSRFDFAVVAATTTASSSTSMPEFTERSNIRLIDRGWEVYATWQGNEASIPYYFCVSSSSPATTTARYGEHITESVFSMLGTTTATSTVFMQDGRTCRTEIKLDHLRQDVYDYAFFPGTADQVVLHLEEGLYVTEIDDRAWQNTQPLLVGNDIRVVFENDVIYVKRDGHYFELIPEIESN